MALAGELDMTFIVGVYHQSYTPQITPEKAQCWARWVGTRYRHVPNLVWSMYPRAEERYVPLCADIAAGLRKGGGDRHLLCVHPDPAVASSSVLPAGQWPDFHMIQTCTVFHRIAEAVRDDYQLTPTRPVVMEEGGYEGLEFGRLQTPADIRRQAYWTQLAGGHHVYGHNGNWTEPLAWKQWLHSPGAKQLTVFRQIFTSLPRWWRLMPDESLILEGAGAGFARSMAARDAAGCWLLAYLGGPSTIRLNTAGLAGSAMEASWINPADGVRLPATNGIADDMPSFTLPRGWEDGVLLLIVK